MAITFGTYTLDNNSSDGTSHSTNHTVASGAMVLVRVGFRGLSSSISGLSVKIGTTNMTLARADEYSSGREYCAIYYEMNPPTGVISVNSTWTNTSSYSVSIVDVYGINKSAGHHSATGNNATGTYSVSSTITGLSVDDLIIAQCTAGNIGGTGIDGVTGASFDYSQMLVNNDTPSKQYSVGASDLADSSSRDVTFSWSNGTTNSCMSACAFTPAGGNTGNFFLMF